MKKTSAFRGPLALAIAALLATTGLQAAHACTGSAIKMIVPNPAGGIGDIVARIISEKAGTILEQPIVIENRAGAATAIGTSAVVNAKPDGCTILAMPSSGVVVSVLKDVPYNLERDLAPILGVGSLPMVLAVPAASPFKSFADLSTAIKSKEGITYASGGAGTLAHLAAARLVNELAGTGNHIPYRGSPDAMQGLMGSQVQLFFPSTAEAFPLLKSGRIRVIGVTTDSRIQELAGVPTMKELGFADFNPRLWYAFMAPASTPAKVIQREHDAFAKALQDPGVLTRLNAIGFFAEGKDAPAVSATMKSEAKRWGKVIKDNNIQASE